MTSSTIRFVEPSVVAELLRGPMRQEVAVVDCRDDDFAGGHIRGAINMHAEHFGDDAAVDGLIDSRLAGKSRVVLHCMLSQQRGPRCAARLAQRLQDRGLAQPAVLVMSGGWSRFNGLFGGEPDLVEHDAMQ